MSQCLILPASSQPGAQSAKVRLSKHYDHVELWVLRLLAIFTCTALALSFSSTRGIGILGTGILILLFPVPTILAIICGCIAAYLFRKGI